MDFADFIATRIRKWPRERQRLLARIVEEMEPENAANEKKTVCGLWAGGGVDVTDEQIGEARREMFGGFPHEDL
jgi:hypothetical protein